MSERYMIVQSTAGRRLHEMKPSAAPNTEITINGKGGVRTLCLCAFEDAARIKAALEAYDEAEIAHEGR